MPRYFIVYAVVFSGLAVAATILSAVTVSRTGNASGALPAVMAWIGWLSFMVMSILMTRGRRP